MEAEGPDGSTSKTTSANGAIPSGPDAPDDAYFNTRINADPK
jgi:hypothetical protein